jgi:hypothetical protein
MKKIFAWLKWFLLNGSFLYIVYLALYEQITWAENVTMFFSHVFVFGLLMYSIVAAIDEKIKAEYRENKNVPVKFDIAIDTILIIAFAAHGWFYFATLFFVQMLLSGITFYENKKATEAVQ